ncbi:MAG: hypothetical protein ACJ789_10620 [Thermomicrobiales bacterium]
MNGSREESATERTRPLRFVFFGRSIVSDWQNPEALTSRAVLRALNHLGHETRFLEERRNQPTVELLRARGAGPLREFAAEYPDLVYRTYELPKRRERTLWLGRELADADAVVVFDDTPSDVLAELARISRPRLVRVIALTGNNEPPFAPDILLDATEMTLRHASEVAADLAAAVSEELARRGRPSAGPALR